MKKKNRNRGKYVYGVSIAAGWRGYIQHLMYMAVTIWIQKVISMCATGIPMIVMRMWEHIKNHFCRKGNWQMVNFAISEF